MATKVEVIVVDGIKFRRYPLSRRRHLRVYYWAHTRNKQPPFSLHCYLWARAHGPIPEGAVIHHGDGNPANKDISNLECVTMGEHAREHGRRGDFSTDRALRHLA